MKVYCVVCESEMGEGMFRLGELCSYTYRCTKCGCVASFDRHASKKIIYIERKFRYEGDEVIE